MTYRHHLPQLDGGLFLTDAGLETDLIFHHDIEIPEFAAHTLLPDEGTRAAVTRYMEPFLELARDRGYGFVLDAPTWRAQPHFADALGQTDEELRESNMGAAAFAGELRDRFSDNAEPIVINGLVGPRGDAYAPEWEMTADEAERYHSQQLGWLAETEVDMVSAMTFTRTDEAIGVVRAAASVGVPIAMSFTVETDGRLPTGTTLGDAITTVDDATDGSAAYFMVNCAHPDHFASELTEELTNADWVRRVRGIRCNASRMSHAELDESEVLDDGDPAEFGDIYRELSDRLPWLNVFGGCCGSDFRHVAAVADALGAR